MSFRSHPLVADECIRFNDEALNLIEGDSRIRVVILAGRWAGPFSESNANPLIPVEGGKHDSYPSHSIPILFLESLSASVQRLQRAGKHVIIFDDVPNFDFDPVLRFRTDHILPRHALTVFLGLNADRSGTAPLPSRAFLI